MDKKETATRAERREMKKRQKMKVSGAGVKTLKRIICKKALNGRPS
jgi:hypothetical protein